MQKIFLIIILGLNATWLSSQNKGTISLLNQGNKVSYEFYNDFYNFMSDEFSDYEFNKNINSSALSIIPTVKKSGTKLIEGIETKSTSKATIRIKLSNIAFDLDTVLSRNYSIVASSERDLDRELINKIKSDNTFSIAIKELLEYISKVPDCNSVKNNVHILESENKLKEALTLLLKIENSFPNCKNELAKYKKSLIEKYESKTCEDMLYEAKILINSGNDFQMNKAVSLLLKIPPTAKCREEALKVSKELSEKKILNKNNSEKLLQYNNLIIRNDSDWLHYLLNN